MEQKSIQKENHALWLVSVKFVQISGLIQRDSGARRSWKGQ